MHNIRGTTWFSLVAIVFCALLLSALILIVVIFFGIRFGFFLPFLGIGTLPILILAACSILLGTLIASIFGRFFLKPIKELREATKKVAKGDFSVHVENDQINELGELTRSFNKMVSDLAGIEILRNDFIANVSHEFKTPIASIEGCAVLLQSPHLTAEERLEYTNIISANAHRLSVLTGNILRLSKLENQKIIPMQTSFSLDEQIRQAILLLEPQWTQKDMELDIEMDTASFFGSEELLMQVWLNLIGNAIKFSNQGDTISISLSRMPDHILVSIADTGIGMDPDVLEHIFDKFYQGDKAHTQQGNGLGLALVKKIVELSGGSITVDSTPGIGSKFTVSLPVEKTKSEKTRRLSLSGEKKSKEPDAEKTE